MPNKTRDYTQLYYDCTSVLPAELLLSDAVPVRVALCHFLTTNFNL